MTPLPKRILICSPLPSEHNGASLVIFYQYIKYLAHQNYEIFFIACFGTSEVETKRYDKFCADFTSSKFTIVPWVASEYFKAKRKGLIKKICFNEIPKEILAAINVFSPNILLTFDIVSAGLMSRLGIDFREKIVILGDLIYQTMWHHNLYAVKEGSVKVWKLLYYWMMSVYWVFIYKNILKKYDHVITMVKKGEADLARIGIKAEYHPFPWFSTLPPVDVTKKKALFKPTFLVYGSMNALGSRSALHFLLYKLYPLALEKWGASNFQINICGAGNIPNWAIEKINALPELEYYGFVDDLTAMMEASHAILAPIDVPVGSRTRIVNAMRMRTLIIAHKNTTLGNPDLVHLENCLLAFDAESFFNEMNRAYSQPKLVDQIIENAEKTYNKYFLPELATKKLIDLIEVC